MSGRRRKSRRIAVEEHLDNHEDPNTSKPLTKAAMLNTFRRRTIGGNFVGMALCLSYFVYFDSVYISHNLDLVFYCTLAFFVFQTGVTGACGEPLVSGMWWPIWIF